MRVAVDELVPVREPEMRVQHEQILTMFLRPGSIELGFRRSQMARLKYDAGEMSLCHRHVESWIRTDEPHLLSLAISDTALRAACDEASADPELPGVARLVDTRIGLWSGLSMRRGLRDFQVGGCFWIPSSRRSPWHSSRVTRCGLVLCGLTEAD